LEQVRACSQILASDCGLCALKDRAAHEYHRSLSARLLRHRFYHRAVSMRKPDAPGDRSWHHVQQMWGTQSLPVFRDQSDRATIQENNQLGGCADHQKPGLNADAAGVRHSASLNAPRRLSVLEAHQILLLRQI